MYARVYPQKLVKALTMCVHAWLYMQPCTVIDMYIHEAAKRHVKNIC